MFSNPYDTAHELARSITKSEIFKNYLQAKQVLDQKPDLRDKVLAFRNQQMEVNRAQISGEEIDGEKIKELSLEFAKLNQNKDIAAFFNA